MFRSIIIEDEPLAASLLERYTSQCPSLENVRSFRNAVEANQFLTDNEVDLIFLDLHLPKIRGFDFLERLEKRYYVILTTAYSDYALEGFEKGVIDYLLKPILYSRFQLAVDRLKDLVSNNEKQKNALSIQVNKTKIRIPEANILYIESSRGYVNVYDKDAQMYRTKISTQSIHQILSPDFLRIHKSYIINKNWVSSLSSTEVTLNSAHTLPIGRKFKDEVLSGLSDEF